MTDQNDLFATPDAPTPDAESLTLATFAERAYLDYAISVVKGRALPEDAILMPLFDLTPTEARIMSRMGDGESPAALKEDFGISANTVKTHLARIFAKTGCGRQADLVRLMSELSLPTHADTSRRLQRRVNGTEK